MLALKEYHAERQSLYRVTVEKHQSQIVLVPHIHEHEYHDRGNSGFDVRHDDLYKAGPERRSVNAGRLLQLIRQTSHNLKVIFEVDSLTIEEVKRATEVAIEAGADFVKTSTGFFTGGKNEGATYEVIEAMMEAADGRCKIKGAGGIRDREKFLRLIDMGIDRMGIGYKSTAKVLGLDK